jgi:hypothetical protein
MAADVVERTPVIHWYVGVLVEVKHNLSMAYEVFMLARHIVGV